MGLPGQQHRGVHEGQRVAAGRAGPVRQACVTDGYLSTTLLFSALIAGGAALQIVTRLRTEETEHRGDTVLATPVTRSGWAGGHLAAAFTASGLAVVAGGLGLGTTYGLVVGDAGQVPRLVGVSLVYLPPVWLLAGLALALLGAAPRWVAAAWGVWAACLVLGLFGTVIDVPEAVRDLSPFEAVPALPAESITWCRSSSWPRRRGARGDRPHDPPPPRPRLTAAGDGLRSADGPTAGGAPT